MEQGICGQLRHVAACARAWREQRWGCRNRNGLGISQLTEAGSGGGFEASDSNAPGHGVAIHFLRNVLSRVRDRCTAGHWRGGRQNGSLEYDLTRCAAAHNSAGTAAGSFGRSTTYSVGCCGNGQPKVLLA